MQKLSCVLFVPRLLDSLCFYEVNPDRPHPEWAALYPNLKPRIMHKIRISMIFLAGTNLRITKQRTLPKERPLSVTCVWTELLELHRRKNAGSLNANRIQRGRIETQGLEDGRRDLRRAHCGAHRPRLEARMR